MNLKNIILQEKKHIAFLIVICGFWVSTWTFSSVLEGKAVTSLVDGGFSSFIKPAIGMLICRILYCVGLIVVGTYRQFVYQKINKEIRLRVISNIESSTYNNFHKNDSSTYVSWLTNDIGTINDEGLSQVYGIMESVWEVVIDLSTLLMINYTFGVTISILSVAILTVPNFYRSSMRKSIKKVSQVNERATSIFVDIFDGFDTLFNMNMRSVLKNKTNEASNLIMKYKVRNSKIIGASDATINTLSVFCIFLVILQSGWLISMHRIPVGMIITISALTTAIFNSLTEIGMHITHIKGSKVIFDKFNELENGFENNHLKQTVPVLSNEISVSNLTANYNDSKEINFTADYHFKKNSKYIIMGASGVGKSTLLKMIAGIILPQSGDILYEGIPYDKLNQDEFRDYVTYLDQTPHIFSDTLLFNLTLGRSISIEDITAVLAFVNLIDFCDSLPEGLNTIIEKNGFNLSGGQKQRIALARILLTRSDILLFDEATSSLDLKNEIEIEKRLLMMEDKTIIMILHHYHQELEEYVDRVIHLK